MSTFTYFSFQIVFFTLLPIYAQNAKVVTTFITENGFTKTTKQINYQIHQ